MGFLNLLVSLGGFLLLFALWIRWADKSTLFRTMVPTAGATLLFFLHMVGFGLYALSVIAYELVAFVGSGKSRGLLLARRGVVVVGHLVPAMALYFGASPLARHTVSKTSWADMVSIWAYWGKLQRFSI